MNNMLDQIALCVERGKINLTSPFPADMKGQKGADELTKEALAQGITAKEIVEKGLIAGMENIGHKFREGNVFVPDVLIAAKAMKTAMTHIRPFFQSGEVQRKGTMIIGTVTGDLHDIGKNLVAMIIEGAGWEVIDLGVDVSSEKFLDSIQTKPAAIVGISALLTTTMPAMEKTVKDIKSKFPAIKILIGGAPINQAFASQIGADGYSPDPQGAVEFLNHIHA
jgi:methanogenic corrinoid protein MtbC1